MPIQLFQIFLDKGKDVPYFSGEKISGKFVVVVVNSCAHNGIYIKFQGHAIIKWTEESSCCEHTVAKQRRARKQFFNNIFNYAEKETLSEGTHIFPFVYHLPSNLPSSLATPTTTIWYKLEVVIDKEPKPRWEVLVFPVKGRLDLNDLNHHGDNLDSEGNKEPVVDNSIESVEHVDKDLRIPISEVKSHSILGFYLPFLCHLHYTSIGVRVSQSGFVPGDVVTINVALITDLTFTFVSLSLVQEITVVTKEKTMIERRTIMKLLLPDLTAEDSDDYRLWDETIRIPKDSVVSSNAKDYPDIKINYFILFCAEATKFPYKGVKLRIPLTVGSIPLKPLTVSPSASLALKVAKYDNDDKHDDDVFEEEKVKIPEILETQENASTSVIVSTHNTQQEDQKRNEKEILATPCPTPTIIVEHLPPLPPPPAEELEEGQEFPSLTESFYNSLEDSLLHVTPKKSPNATSNLSPLSASPNKKRKGQKSLKIVPQTSTGATRRAFEFEFDEDKLTVSTGAEDDDKDKDKKSTFLETISGTSGSTSL